MSDWMTIRVVLIGQGDGQLRRPPGRVLLVHADHTFADFAEALDTSFGRWDLTPLHQFQVEGRILLSPGAAAEGDVEAEDSDEVIIGEVGLREGARFAYVFDLGELWTHECTVEDVGIDPFELAGEEPELPVPVYGWGTIPDQYGRESEDDEDAGQDTGADEAYEDTVAYGEDASAEEDLYADEDEDADEESDVDEADEGSDVDEADEDEAAWDDLEDSSWEVVARALAEVEREPDPDALAQAAARLRSADDEAVSVLWAAAALDRDDTPADDDELWTRLAAAVVQPQGDTPLDDESADAWAALEPADWAGAVVELVRSGPGTLATPDALIQLIERCPEVESDELSAEDDAQIRAGLQVVADLWAALGALDQERALTRLGMWGLPRALERAWDLERAEAE